MKTVCQFLSILLLALVPVKALSADIYKDAATELNTLIATTPELAYMLNEVLALQPDTSYWHGKTSDDIVPFFSDWLTCNPLPENPGSYIRLFDELVNSRGGELLFNNNVFSSWFIGFLDARGGYLGTSASASCVPQWIADTTIHIDDYVIPEGGFADFNAFFLRTLKPGARPLAGEGDPSILVSPADGSIRRIYAADLESNFEVKRDVLNIRQVLNNSPYADRFIGGDIVDILLWFTDYHHFHSPIAGDLVYASEYAGSYNYNFAEVNWFKELARHKRLCYLIDSEEFGLVAMIPVGFWGVGSIVTECQVGDYIEKGQELGHFAYGGSSILLVFEPGVIRFTPEISEENQPVQVRSRIGISTQE
ncbi:MAG: phosphatidylserine decarboxylase [Candidatus Sabulitectum sp.]|nr:phosphatidylserine decarboxylase [Candidatus Sabulitectum sp.]